MYPEDILPTYEKEAANWQAGRDQSLWETPLLTEALAGQSAARVLDLGCGSGLPIARWFLDQGAQVTCVDGAAAMVEICAANLPEAEVILADMRGLALGQTFDVILAFNSFFHLSGDDQRSMFPVFAAHAAPSARLLFTSGTKAGTALGKVGNSTIYHESLAPAEYRSLMAENGFKETWYRPEDKRFRGHSIWLATQA